MVGELCCLGMPLGYKLTVNSRRLHVLARPMTTYHVNYALVASSRILMVLIVLMAVLLL